MTEIKIKTEYITLGQFLKLAGIIDYGGLAKTYLLQNDVVVNNQLENRRGRKLYKDYQIKVEDKIFLIKNED